MNRDAFVKFVLATILLLVPRIALSQVPAPLSIAREGYVYAGGKYSNVDGRQVMNGQLYAEYQIPTTLLHPYPIVMVHGAGSSGANFMGTPDGREGWAQFFLRQGYAVYIIDQPGRGRAAYVSDAYGPLSPVETSEALQQRITRIEDYNLWPQAHLHTQWPGAGKPGDSSFDSFMASRLPVVSDFTLQQMLSRDAIIGLLTKIGPAILLTHSQAGAFGWPVADARPDLVKAIVAVEPSGPPFYDIQDVGAPEWFRYGTTLARPWGITADPLTYSPSAQNPSDLQIVEEGRPDSPELCKCWLQKDPARQLPNLKGIPILVVTSEASYHAPYDHCTVKFLEQAGLHPTWIKLTQVGIHGNGHNMMLEKNNMEIASALSQWLAKAVSGKSHGKAFRGTHLESSTTKPEITSSESVSNDAECKTVRGPGDLGFCSAILGRVNVLPRMNLLLRVRNIAIGPYYWQLLVVLICTVLAAVYFSFFHWARNPANPTVGIISFLLIATAVAVWMMKCRI